MANGQGLRVLIAPNAFKGSLSAPRVADALARGMRAVWPAANLIELPLADGGEGTAEALARATGGSLQICRVRGPLGVPVDAQLGWLGDGRTAVIECAQAAGLTLLGADARDPRAASTQGMGQLVLAALDGGARRLLFALGGSATNDGGAGLLQAVGVRLLDAAGEALPPGGAALARLDRIDLAGLDPRLTAVEVLVACDVDNPLTGPYGASAVYGPQKGADPAAVAELDRALTHFADVAEATLGAGRRLRDVPGAGAAGGLGFGLLTFLGAHLVPGAELVCNAVGFDEQLRGAHLVVTGEGRLDGTSRHGKLPAHVASRAAKHGVPTVAVVGSVASDAANGAFVAVMPICRGPMTLAQAMAEAPALLLEAGKRLAQLMELGRALPR